MQDVALLYQQSLEGYISPKKPEIPYYSTVKEKFMTDEKELGPSYWAANLVSPVLFHSGIKAVLHHQQLMGSPHVEIGPHCTLAGPLKQIYKEVGCKPQYLSMLTRNVDARKTTLKAVGQLFSTGIDIDFAAINLGGTTLPGLTT
jgi:acyl transferase domain-containing protein